MLPTISGLIPCSAVFLPAEPARDGRIAFWSADPDADIHLDGLDGVGAAEELTVVTPDLRRATVTARVLPLAEALPLLTRVRAASSAGAAPFWGAAALLALRFAARGLLLPGLSPAGYDAWRLGPLDAADLEEVRDLAAAMPPDAHCVPVDARDGYAASGGSGNGNGNGNGNGGNDSLGGDREAAAPPRLPAPETLLRAFLDAVADTLPRSPAAPAAVGGSAYAARPARLHPELRDWAAEIAAGHDAGVRVSLRIEVDPDAEPPVFRAVLQMHGLADATLVADAADVWAGSGPAAAAFPPRARLDALRALRRAARLWSPLSPLLTAAVPDAVELADEEVAELLGEAAGALAAHGVLVHWPRGLARTLTARAVVGRPATGPALPGLLSVGAAHPVGRRYALGDQGDLTAEELNRLAEAKRPLVRLRDQWVLIDPAQARRARDLARQDLEVTAADALAAVLTGSAELDGTRYDVEATGPLAQLRTVLTADPERVGPEQADPEHGLPEHADVQAPDALHATLRDYQLRGLRWLDRLTALGFGACLADDMGLGKTVTLIALHLHRQEHRHQGPTLVVCPASLLGNWQREIEKFAPGTPVRRFHGAGRSLEETTGGFVLTTYGTMRLDAPRLAAVRWGMVVADEAQHVKNPRSSTAKALRTIHSDARVALTGTPVENNLSELWAVLDWTTPGLLGRLGTFRTRYAEPVESGRDPRAAARLGALVRPFLLRRKKSDPGIAPELPPKTETDHAVSLTPEQAGLYEAVVRETLAAIAGADGMERRGLVVKLLTSLKQICNHPAQYLGRDEAAEHGVRGNAGAASGKLELLDELLDTILAEGGSVLVFSQYVTMARLLERHLAARGIASQLLHGGTPVPRREELVDRFQAGEVPVFLLSLKAAGTGLNLTRAAHVIHYDRWWNPAVEEQATDRAYRIGQTQPVQVHRIIAEGTVEDRIAEMLEAKRALADAVLTGGETALTELSDAELAELVALRPTGPGERHG
ncbi:DEAD/DEAH box helicase [Streptomyces sp. H27-H1]|uniref:DEAD/DEAH box helicase n=1 Tax=Streptomyces sp. H27-H1 TaxID=2996461 RepID=UPI0022717C2F|nr:DEAD/DEAH box helicase [Streptomyces sp. H27-H1]MCY0926357.1 DEAD/DEAH box helicase [Streptomyces sp. H27-H1]